MYYYYNDFFKNKFKSIYTYMNIYLCLCC